MKIIIFGAPGSGKGTQAELIKNEFKLNHISTGDIIRDEIKNNRPFSKSIKEKIKKGALIKDQTIFKILEKYLKNNKNILLDGFPRTLTQAKFLTKTNLKIDYIINIRTKKTSIIKRIKYRIINNNINYNIIYKKPKIKNRDDKTGEILIKRQDDLLETIEKRLKEYYSNIKDILSFFENKTKIIEINGEKNIKETYKEIKTNIKKHI
jgi:adenylate kinase